MTVPGQIGGWRVERLLGTGSFATVWLAADPVLDARVAIKVLAENWSHDLRVRERFEQEARLLWSLADDRLVRVHAVGELPDGRPYTVMELAAGGSLRDRLAGRPLDPAAAVRLLLQIAAGVAVLHAHRIVHRDLTPGNILFQPAPPGPDRVLIADLGLAKALAAASGLTARAGTPGYMAPEQDDPLAVVDLRADVYGLGRLGRRLLLDDRGTPVAGVPAGVGAVLRRATATDPRARYPDAAAFGAALEHAARAEAGRGRPAVRAVAALVACAALAGVSSDVARPPGPRTAQDGTGRITVVLPDGWRAAGSGWAGSPATGGGLEPALVLSPHPQRWATDPTVAGAFVGLSPGAARRTTAAGFVAEHPHARCTAAPVRRPAGTGWVVARFACSTGRPVIVEAAAPAAAALVYAQVTVPAGTPDATIDALLAGIAVR